MDFYYDMRNRFNDLLKEDNVSSNELSCLFYYLMKTCFNGLCRFNRSGKFNTPFGKYKTIKYKYDFREYTDFIKNWMISSIDFMDLKFDKNYVVYCDPPYDGTFVNYTDNGFSWDRQIELAKWISQLSNRVIVSNAATDRIIELYRDFGFEIHFISASRAIAANGNREKANEILAVKERSEA